MKLKSSNKKTYIFLAGLILSATLLFVFKTTLVKKPSKYPVSPKVEKKTELDLIQISLNEKQYKKLKKKKNIALSVGTLETSSDDFVAATVTYNGIDYKAEVRLKGDHLDHLKGDQWSFRVKLKNDKTILGMRKFSLHKPQTRRYINEWLYHKAIKKEGLIGLRYDFLEVSIHIKKRNTSNFINKDVGIYAIEESFDKRTIENNQRKESVILKFSENYYWSEWKKAHQIEVPYSKRRDLINHDYDFAKVSPINVYSEEKVLKDETLFNYFKLGKNLLEDVRRRKITLDEAFDVKELAMQNAILNLFGAKHGIAFINLRFYYNPITSKLEPIAFDGNAGVKIKEYSHFRYINRVTDSIYLKELSIALQKVSKPEYLKNLFDNNQKELEFLNKTLKKEFKTELISRSSMKANQTILQNEIKKLKK